MNKVVGFIIGTALIVAGALTGNVGLIIQGAAMIVTQAIVDLTMPKTPARQASEMEIQLGEQPRSAFFGEGFTAGSLVDALNYGGKYGTDWEALVIRLADHKCAGLTSFIVNDEVYAYTADGNVAAFNGEHYEHLHIFFRGDTTTDPLPAEITANWPGWSAADIGQSGCDVIVAYRCDTPNSKNPIWPGGRPRFGFVLKGKYCYDPRLDSTVAGGSGTHRWEDPSTWEWSENPSVCRYNWARGVYANDQVTDPSQLLIGRGLSAQEAPPENVAAAANLCDEVVGGAVRYRIAGPVYANQDHIDVEQMFALATAGSVVTREGSVELEPGASKSIVATITDDDLLKGSKVSWNNRVLSEASSDRVNTVVARYVEPAQKWNDFAAPVVRSTADILADGKPLEAQLSLRLVKDQAQALRIAEIQRRLGRLWGRMTITVGPRHCELEEGDWIAYQSDRYFGGATINYRIEAYSIDEKWQPTWTLREINSSVFGDDGSFDPDYSVVSNTTTPPVVGAPAGASWALAAVTLDNAGTSVPALEITGAAADDDLAQAIIFEYWQSDGVINPVTNPDDPAWLVYGTQPPTTTKVDITSIQPGGTYYAAVTYVVSGYPGDRLVLGPVTAATLTASVSDADKGDITVSIGGTVWTIDNAVVTNAKLANMATKTIKARKSGTPGVPEDCSLSDVLDFIGSAAHGDILYRGSATWARLPAGTSGQFLKTLGAAASPVWDNPAAAIAAKDEGTTLTSTATSFNFVGGGVVASHSGGDVTVTIPGGAGSGGTNYEAGPPATVPTVASLTWVNQGTATATDGFGGILVDNDVDGEHHLLVQTAPATPFNVYMRVEAFPLSTSTSLDMFDEIGIALRDSAGGDFLSLDFFNRRPGTGQLRYELLLGRWTNPTTFSANPVVRDVTKPLKWLRANVTSTTVTFYVSLDGLDWTQVGTETISTFVGSINQVGMTFRSSGTTSSSILVSYFSTTAPS